jgi:hypothetical protein
MNPPAPIRISGKDLRQLALPGACARCFCGDKGVHDGCNYNG